MSPIDISHLKTQFLYSAKLFPVEIIRFIEFYSVIPFFKIKDLVTYKHGVFITLHKYLKPYIPSVGR